MEQKNYNKVAYQTFDLVSSGSLTTIYQIQNFINKNYNFIEGYLFYFTNSASIFPYLIEEFKIDDTEILPKGFFIDNLFCGKSIPFKDRFTPLNIPIGQGKFSLKVTQQFSASDFKIIFKLNNKESVNENLDFFKYETHFFKISSLLSPNERIYKNSIRIKNSATEIKGVAINFLEFLITQSNPVKNHQLGILKMSINSKKSNPINIPIFNHPVSRINYKKEFIELNEKVEPGSTIDFSFEEYRGISTTTFSPADLNLFLTIKLK